MGDAGGEASDGGEAVAETEFALKAANLSEIGKGVDVADGSAAGSLESAATDAEELFSSAGSARPHLATRSIGLGRQVEEELLHIESGEILSATAQQSSGGRIDQLDGTL